MATGDLWVSYKGIAEGGVAAFDTAGTRIFYQENIVINQSPYNDELKETTIVANENTVVAVFGNIIYCKQSEDAEFHYIRKVESSYGYQGAVVRVWWSGYFNGKFMFTAGGWSSTVGDFNRLFTSVDGVTWTYKSFPSPYVGYYFPIAVPYQDPSTLRSYIYIHYDLSFRNLQYTDDFVSYTGLFGNSDLQADYNTNWRVFRGTPLYLDGYIYVLCCDLLAEASPPVVAKVSASNGSYTYLPFSTGGRTISIYSAYSGSFALTPEGAPFILLDDDESTCGFYVLSGSAFVRDDSKSNDIYWYSGSRIISNARIGTPVGFISAAGGQMYDNENEIWLDNSFLMPDYSRVSAGVYEGHYLPQSWHAYAVESGPYVPLEEEFWTEERLAIETEYSY